MSGTNYDPYDPYLAGYALFIGFARRMGQAQRDPLLGGRRSGELIEDAARTLAQFDEPGLSAPKSVRWMAHADQNLPAPDLLKDWWSQCSDELDALLAADLISARETGGAKAVVPPHRAGPARLKYKIEEAQQADRDQLARFIETRWGSRVVVVSGNVYLPAELPALIARAENGDWLGVLTYAVHPLDYEVITLDSLQPGVGIGSAQLESVCECARLSGSRSVRLVTTNDNLNALGFYQKHGFYLRAVRPGAVNEARRLKPEIPLTAENGIEIRDELELEREVSTSRA